MGYRALLKQYIRHLLKVTGDHHIHIAEASLILSRRDVAELKLLAAEIDREDGEARRTRVGGGLMEADAASLAAGKPAARAYSAGVVSAAASAGAASAGASAAPASAGIASADAASADAASAGAASTAGAASAAGATSAAGAAGAGAAVSAPL
jgi:hypothetical protein